MTTVKSKIKSKPTAERIIKAIVNNSNVHLLDVNKKIRTNNLSIHSILQKKSISDDVRTALTEIYAINSIIIKSNKLFSSAEFISVNKNEDDGN